MKINYSLCARGVFIATLVGYTTLCSAEVVLGGSTVHGLSLPLLNQEQFAGIPFAEPPVGELRFKPPVLRLNPNVTSLDATQFGASCSQFISGGSKTLEFPNLAVSEDCLFINVFRPAGLNTSSNLPVMVWIYGGGFFEGSSTTFNASALVAQSIERDTPIVYVSLNYRLGPLGFPQGDEAASKGALNLGLKDIVAGLNWVRENIGAFGGDREKVTIFGQSAGSIMISQLFLNSSFDLARAAIMESGAAATAFSFNASRDESNWALFVAGVPECVGTAANDTFACLRAASFDTTVNAADSVYAESPGGFPFLPVGDGPGGLIPDVPSTLYAQGRFSRLPFIAGNVLDEGTDFVPSAVNSTAEIRDELLLNTSPSTVSDAEHAEVIERILELYPDIPALGSPYGTGNETFGLSSQYKRTASVVGDLAFQSLRRSWTQTAVAGGSKAFGYLFTDPQPSSPAAAGIQHASEVPYIYGVAPNGPASIVLGHTMMDYWLSFATSLDPNDCNGNTSRPHWAQYTPDSHRIIQLNSENLTMIPDTFRQTQMAFLNANPAALLH
ncbi:hypothetical protein EW145_g6183 [Phellinidium pouzarii]|uniref:Carboxylic ester hydrolase n=1 Tax=Phellinidium pouzarii TaxID=167371 RepID=A0A4S4KZ70_9AGAM|nr:hypothetical protein EW145_g6183 [Phellinidium pouzarii]